MNIPKVLCGLFLVSLIWPCEGRAGVATIQAETLDGVGTTPDSNNQFMVFQYGDVQYFSRNNGDQLIADLNLTTTWICDNLDAQNIKAAIFPGDLVDNPTNATQWTNFDSTKDILDGCGVPYVATRGNHDTEYEPAAPFPNYATTCANYATHLWEDYTTIITEDIDTKPWYLEEGPPMFNDNGVQRGGGMVVQTWDPNYLVISFPWCDGNGVNNIGFRPNQGQNWTRFQDFIHFEWLKTILAKYPDKKFLHVSHFQGVNWNWNTLYGDFADEDDITFISPVDDNRNAYRDDYRDWIVDEDGDRVLTSMVGHATGSSKVDWFLADATDCEDCMPVGTFNLQSALTTSGDYNFHTLHRFNFMTREVCRRSLRVDSGSIVWDSPSVESANGSGWFCGYDKTYKDRR